MKPTAPEARTFLSRPASTHGPVAAALLAIALGLAGGCERSPSPAPVATTRPAEPQAPAEPDPSGPRRLSLVAVPFSVELPSGWDVEPDPGGNFFSIRGPRASFDHEGLLARRAIVNKRDPLKPDTLELAIRTFQERGEQDANVEVEVYELAPMRVVAVRETLPPPATQPGQPALEAGMTETFYVYAPEADGTYSSSEISFYQATLSDARRDHETVLGIVRSLRPEAPATAPVTP